MTIRWSDRPEGSYVTPGQWLDGRSTDIAYEIRDVQMDAQLSGNPPFTPYSEGAVEAVLGPDDDGGSLLGSLLSLFGR